MDTFKTRKGTELQLLNLKGKSYLAVAQRLVWFREEHPDWRIETDFSVITEGYAMGKAVIRNDKGDVMATAHKREDAKHFPDFCEKAETGAIGRALALCGYGTQFCADELDEGQRIVDAPQAVNIFAAKNNQPASDDGYPTTGNPYRFKTGKFKLKTPEEVSLDDLRKWVDYWDTQQSKGAKVEGMLKQDLDVANEHICYFENTLDQEQRDRDEMENL